MRSHPAAPESPTVPPPGDADVLQSVPTLGAVVDLLGRVDRLIAAIVDGLIDLDDHSVAEVATKLPLEQWLAIAGQRTRSDRRMLLTCCEVFRRLPSLRAAFCETAEVSWAQVRAVVLQVYRLPRHLDASLDAGIAEAIARCFGADPDALSAQVGWVITDLQMRDTDDARPESTQSPQEPDYFAMQPRLDGTGGRVWGEFGPVGFATLDAALQRGAPDGSTRDRIGQAPDRDRSGAVAVSAGRQRAARLIEICDGTLGARADRRQPTSSAGPDQDAAGETEPDFLRASGGQSAPEEGTVSDRSPVRLLLRAELSSLLDRDETPAALLTHLLGGRMWVDAATARELINSRGADLRTVVLDDTGRTVGVGRRRRIAPGWLRDAALAVHDICTAPGCLTAARVCDLDHARPWRARLAEDRPGQTDVGQLGPLCRTDNRTKESAGWSVTQHPDGSRTWRHTVTGLTTRTHPGTRPPARSRPSRGWRAGPLQGDAPHHADAVIRDDQHPRAGPDVPDG